VKVHAGAPVIETEMVEEDFKELAAAGGQAARRSRPRRPVKDGPTARKDGGVGAQIRHPEHDPHRRTFDSRFRPDRQGVVLEADTDVIGHINGGHTALARRPDPLHLRGLQARA